MIETHWRKTYQKLCVDPLLSFKWCQKLSPWVVTIAACVLGILTWPFLALGYKWVAVSLLAVSGFLDTVDGTLARMQNSASSRGAALDILSDRLVESSVILGLFAVAPATRAWPCLLMLASILICITSFLVVGIFEKQESEKSFFYSPGLMERAEAFIFFVLMMLFPSWFWPLALIFSALVLFTALFRMYQFSVLSNDLGS